MTTTMRPTYTTCPGCDDAKPCRAYTVTYTDGRTEPVVYCEDCAALARVNWNGEITTITPLDPVATFAVGRGYQPVRPTDPHARGYLQFPATIMMWAVDVPSTGVRFHGFPTEYRARYFANSCDSTAAPVRVEPYWYVEAWGRVPTEAVHAYDEPAQNAHTRPAAARVLGCGAEATAE